MGSGAGGAAGLYAMGLKAEGSSARGISFRATPGGGLIMGPDPMATELVRESRVCPFWYAGSWIATLSSFWTTGLVTS